MTVHPRPLWLPATILAMLVPVFAGLGGWQLQRADEKQTLQQEYDRRSTEPPLQLDVHPVAAGAQRYRRAIARGIYETEYQVLIDNRVHRGQAGYHVVTPLKLDGGDMRVLVNRGWVPLGASREHLPSVDAPADAQEVTGVLTVPAEKVFTLGDGVSPEQGWQPVWPHLDMRRYGTSVPFPVQPVVLLLDADAPHGYTREWSRLDAGIALHQGYAFQWFALAALAVVIAALLARRALQQRRETRT